MSRVHPFPFSSLDQALIFSPELLLVIVYKLVSQALIYPLYLVIKIEGFDAFSKVKQTNKQTNPSNQLESHDPETAT